MEKKWFTVAEVAEMLGCAVGTVKSRCSRGRARLARLLGMLAPDAPDAPDGDAVHADQGNPVRLPSVPSMDSQRAPPDQSRD